MSPLSACLQYIDSAGGAVYADFVRRYLHLGKLSYMSCPSGMCVHVYLLTVYECMR